MLRHKIRDRLMAQIGGIICNRCNYHNPKALMMVYKEYHGCKNKGTLTSKKMNYYIENADQSREDLIVLCYNCERKKRNNQRPSNDAGTWVKYGRLTRHKIRVQIFDILNKYNCQNCGESDFEILNIDHIKGLGNRSLKDKFNTKDSEYRYYINHFEECQRDLQILCCNCNKLKQNDNNEYGLLQLPFNYSQLSK